MEVCDRLLSEGKLPTEKRERVLKNKQFAIDKLQEISARPVTTDIEGVQSQVGAAPNQSREAPRLQDATASQPGLPVTGFTKRTVLPYAVRRAADCCPEISVENITRRIGYASYVNVERRYMYYQVSKAGCTSMKWLLHSLERLPPIEYFVGTQRESRRDMFIHERSNLKIPSLLDLDDATQEVVLTSPEFMRFTVVRNPYMRTESAWKDKVRLCAPTYERFYGAIKGKLPTGSDSSSLVSFREFVNAISREDLANCDAHWRLQVAQTLRGALNFSHIGRLEDFAKIIRALHAHLGITPPQQSTTLNRTAGASHYDEDIAKAVYELYRQDFEAFGYDPDSWVRPSNESEPAVVPEAIFVDEVLERNIVIDHLYEERDALKRRVQELEISLRDKEQSHRIPNDITAARSAPPSEDATLMSLLQAAWQKGELAHPGDEVIAAYVKVAASCAAPAKVLHQAAKFCRDKGMHNASVLFCETGLALLRPGQEHSPEDSAYAIGLLEEYSIAANYSRDPACKDRGFAACNWLALNRDVPARSRGLARHNLRFYVEPADKIMPSFAVRPVGFTPLDGYYPTNPSIARQGDQIALIQRTVNYTLTDDNRYHTPSGEPSRTRNFLLRLNGNLEIESSTEIFLPLDLPKPAPGIATVFADLRLFAWGAGLWCSGYFRELTPTGLCQQVLGRIDESGEGPCRLTDWRVLTPEGPPQHEKNWMPLVAGETLKFIYRCDPTRVVDEAARTVTETKPAITAEEFRGGTQAIDFDGGRLALVHEVLGGASDKQRVYHHRFVWFDAASALRRVSRPFFFRKKGIEFAAGLAWHPDAKRLLISYGVDDREAWIATVTASDVRAILNVADSLSSMMLDARSTARNPIPENNIPAAAHAAKPTIPRILHFITGLDKNFGGRPFSFVHYMAIRSALQVNKGFRARVYYHYEPSGKYWDAIKGDVELVPVDFPTEVFGNPVELYAHKADVLRMRILLEQGGIYLDLDTICQRPFEPLLDGRVVMGREERLRADGSREAVGLCNATIIAPRNAEFLRLWYEAYRDFVGGRSGDGWNKFSVKVPMALAREHPELLRIEPAASFFWPSWDKAGIASMFARDCEFPEAYSFHLWEAKSWSLAKDVDAKAVMTIDTTYNKIARRFVEVEEPKSKTSVEACQTIGFDELFDRYVSRIDGWLAKEEAAYLYGLAKEAAEGCIVEVGSYRGRATAALAFGVNAGAGLPVYAVEPHEQFRGLYGGEFGPADRGHFMRAMAETGLYRHVRLVNVSSEFLSDKWPMSVSVLFIDGDHRYEAVKRDFECWRGKLAPRAMVVLDEASDPSHGPGQLAHELIDSGMFVREAAIGKMVCLRNSVSHRVHDVDTTNSPDNNRAQVEVDEAAVKISERFSRIYDQKLWGHGSGVGALPEHTVEYRSFLQQFMVRHGIRTVVDLGCGDWQFSRYVDWSGVTYVGIDVVASVIDNNQREFANDNISFRKFESLAKLPPADLLVCKDVLQHLPNETVKAYLAAFRKTYKFSLITNDQEPAHLQNSDIDAGGWRTLRLDQEPFCEPSAVVLSWTVLWGKATTRKATYLLYGNSGI